MRDWKEIAIEKNKRVMKFCKGKIREELARYKEVEYLLNGRCPYKIATNVFYVRKWELLAQIEYYFAVYKRLKQENRRQSE